MAEKTQTRERERGTDLSAATKEVVGLYLGDQLSGLLGTQKPEQREQVWNKTAQEFPEYQAKITTLREALKVVDVDKKAYPHQITSILGMHFGTEDRTAKDLLGDILLSRISESAGYIDYNLEPLKEAQVMADEMNISKGWRSDQAKNLKADQVIEAVLKGELGVVYNPKK